MLQLLPNVVWTQKDHPGTRPTQIIGNRNFQVYHRPDYPSYTATKTKNRVMFDNAAEGEAAGYRVAGNCP